MAISDYYLTPDLDKSKEAIRQKMALALMAQGTSGEPIKHWTQGLARLAQGALGGYALHQQDAAAREREVKVSGAIDTLPGMTPQPSAAPAISPIAGALSPRGIRNNNPLNIEAGQFTQSQPGFAGSDGRFAQFQAPDQGLAAADNLLQVYAKKHGINTVSGVVNRWAPPSDNNPTGAYAATVAKEVGVDPNAPLNMADPSIRQKIIGAMAKFENGQPLQTPQARGPALTQQQVAEIKTLWTDPATRPLAMQKYQQYSTPKEQWRDLTQAERDAAQVPKGVPAQMNTVSGEKKIGQPLVSIDQRSQNEFEQKYGGGLGERALAVLSSADKASEGLAKINVAKQIAGAMETGKLTPAMGTIGAWMKAVGIDPKAAGIDPTLPAKTETMTALANEALLGMLGPGGFPAQNFSDTDRVFMEKIQAQPYDQPETVKFKLEMAARMKKLQIEKARDWRSARKSGKSFEDFESDWNDGLSKRNIFADLEKDLSNKPGSAPSSQSEPVDYRTYFGE